MCDACQAFEAVAGKPGRRRLWEIYSGWHCAIVGTCLSLADLRRLAVKLGYRVEDPDRTDLKLHMRFVQDAGKDGRSSKLLTKLLDKRHETTIRKFRSFKTRDEVLEAWNEALAEGDIPGPFWAAMSHPCLDRDLGVLLYGDVHMLSHLVGSTNRAELARVQAIETMSRQLEARIERDAARHREKLAQRDVDIAALMDEVTTLRGQLAAKHYQSPDACAATVSQLGAKDDLISAENRELRTSLESANAEVARLTSQLNEARQEVRSIEAALTEETEADSGIGAHGPDLDGRRILYVGGRHAHLPTLRRIAAQWGAELDHHDGGLERSIDALAAAVAKADVVVFPIDCVSHSATSKAKTLCRQTMKPFIPVRSSGIASFVVGLKTAMPPQGLDALSF